MNIDWIKGWLSWYVVQSCVNAVTIKWACVVIQFPADSGYVNVLVYIACFTPVTCKRATATRSLWSMQ